ncbi:MAG: hypothetical protein J1F06_06350 [Prevotellaceae bacterium]|nr:hypothetical protein [Prevotellaceae bacterium]
MEYFPDVSARTAVPLDQLRPVHAPRTAGKRLPRTLVPLAASASERAAEIHGLKRLPQQTRLPAALREYVPAGRRSFFICFSEKFADVGGKEMFCGVCGRFFLAVRAILAIFAQLSYETEKRLIINPK